MDTPSDANAPAPPKGTLYGGTAKFLATTKSRPLGEGGCEHSEQTEGVFAAALSGAKPEEVCTLSHKKRAYGRGKAVHCAKKWVCLLPNGGKRAIL